MDYKLENTYPTNAYILFYPHPKVDLFDVTLNTDKNLFLITDYDGEKFWMKNVLDIHFFDNSIDKLNKYINGFFDVV